MMRAVSPQATPGGGEPPQTEVGRKQLKGKGILKGGVQTGKITWNPRKLSLEDRVPFPSFAQRPCEEDLQQSRKQSLTKVLRGQGRRRSRSVTLGGEPGKCPGLLLRVLRWIQMKDCFHRKRGRKLSCPGLLEALQSRAAARRPDRP